MVTRSKHLQRYKEKRDFSKTPEPKAVLASKKGQRYLIQKHAATRLHYDFRLELDGVLKSWAVTRGPSFDPADKRLAVEVEDHPVAYGSFEGIIPKGQYGGGTVMLWDEGSWEPIGDPHEGLKNGKLVFNLSGKRLKGEWTLVRMHTKKDSGSKENRNNWLLIKHQDAFAKTGNGEAFLNKNSTSIVSGRTMDAIAANSDNVWHSKDKKNTNASLTLPTFIAPELATLADSMPQGKDWVHEVKYYEQGQLQYAGKVGTGFNNEMSLDLRKKLNDLSQKDSPFATVTADGRRGAMWVKPALVCEVQFSEWTQDGRLRHPSFQAIREDKPASAITRDIPLPTAPDEKPVTHKKTPLSHHDAMVNGIKISHADRIIYPDTTITKQQLAEYYLSVADSILPHVAGRPLSMLRCPEGIGQKCFFQRHIAHGQSPYLHDTGIKVKGRDETYVMIKDSKGLITLVQWGVIELHPWGCLADKPELPDRIIFDLDPDPQLPWKMVIEGAKEIRARMEEMKLESFVKTTGGKGLHVVIPLTRKYSWPVIKAFAKTIADSMQHDNPKHYIATASKAARAGKIFVDYLRNDLTATAVSAFSIRARPGAPVAMPIAWDSLKTSQKPGLFTIETVPPLIHRQKLKSPGRISFG